MKNTALFFVILVMCSCSKNEFKIAGTIQDVPDSSIIYLYDTQMRKTIDSVSVIGNKFEFKGSVKELSQYYLIYQPDKSQEKYLPIWVDNLDITINGDAENFEKAEVKGTKVQMQQIELDNLLKPIETRLDSIYSVYNEEDTASARILNNLYDELTAAETKIKTTFVENHPDYYYSAYLLNRIVREIDTEKGQALFNSLTEDLKSTSYAGNIKKYLELNRNLKVGDKFVDISLQNINGEAISLSGMANGKYTLIDFWASWCNPCRKENPNLRMAYNKYNEKGFEIYGISLDKSLADWKKALEEDSISWTAVIDTNAFNSDVAMIYSVRFIPHNFLFDPSGKIMAIDLRGEEVEQKLKEVFDE